MKRMLFSIGMLSMLCGDMMAFNNNGQANSNRKSWTEKNKELMAANSNAGLVVKGHGKFEDKVAAEKAQRQFHQEITQKLADTIEESSLEKLADTYFPNIKDRREFFRYHGKLKARDIRSKLQDFGTLKEFWPLVKRYAFGDIVDIKGIEAFCHDHKKNNADHAAYYKLLLNALAEHFSAHHAKKQPDLNGAETVQEIKFDIVRQNFFAENNENNNGEKGKKAILNLLDEHDKAVLNFLTGSVSKNQQKDIKLYIRTFKDGTFDLSVPNECSGFGTTQKTLGVAIYERKAAMLKGKNRVQFANMYAQDLKNQYPGLFSEI